MKKRFPPLAPLKAPLWLPGEVYCFPNAQGELQVQFVLEGPSSVYGQDGPLNSKIGAVVFANYELGLRAIYAIDDPRLRELVRVPIKIKDAS